MRKVTFYHAGCPVCVGAEQALLGIIDPGHQVEVVHLGEKKDRIAEAAAAGVKSVPALVVEGDVLHVNFGASLADLQ
ncbi:thioredoxin family protein [Shimwellia pseudoproteus]|uniref:thioredoxin family protein n=1 Tax=Shimwellia pseudoproteus TaxID=570012 RepID=UPI0018EB03D9|nr:thioredoxin family protein [Shimwellia pseudoproteus]MBJ3814416.1 thioredoxin family protein [Shimwellia pseudoproteus]